MYKMKVLTMVSILSFAHSSPTSKLCSHQFREDQESSGWSEFLSSGLFLPAPGGSTSHHMKRLRHSLAELAAILAYHKEEYVQDMMGESFTQIDRELGDLQYPALAPDTHKDSFLAAYSLFQRLALSIEVVTTDLRHHQHSVHKMWRLSSHTVASILRSIYTELVMKRVEIPEPLTRNVLPDTMRCLPFSAYRDTRDFLVLRHTLQAAEIYSKLLEKK